MPTLLSVLTAVTPSPENTLRPGLDPSQVSPGLVGFLMTFLLAVAVVLLVLDFNRRNRRLRYRAQYAEQRAAEDHVGGYANDDASLAPGTDRPDGDGDRARRAGDDPDGLPRR